MKTKKEKNRKEKIFEKADVLMGNCFLEAGQTEYARDSYKEAHKKISEANLVLIDSGYRAIKNNELDDAFDCFNAANYKPGFLELGKIHLIELNDRLKALCAFRAAARLKD